MIRSTRAISFAAALAAVSGGAVLTGCAASNPMVEIRGILPIEPSMCQVMVGDIFLLNPRLDTSGVSRDATFQLAAGATPTAIRPGGITYIATFQVANAAQNQASRFPLMANPNDFVAEEAEVELRGIDGQPLSDLVLGDQALPARFRVPAVGFVPASAGTDPGLGTVPVEVIPAVYGDALAGRNGQVLVAVELRGTTSGASTQTSGEYVFPLRLCDGCLFQCTPDLENPGTQVVVPSCLPGQDTVTSFCLPTPPV